VKAFISKRALRAAERIDARWRERGDDPAIFGTEFLEAVERLETTRGAGQAFPTPSRRSLKRLLLPQSRCHVYFEIDEAKQRIQILHIWDGRRERGPKL
jgi:hypothetical protein